MNTKREGTDVETADESVVPSGCVDPEVGRKYWEFVRRPESVMNCDERVALMHHASIVCEACLRRVLQLRSQEAGDHNAPLELME